MQNNSDTCSRSAGEAVLRSTPTALTQSMVAPGLLLMGFPQFLQFSVFEVLIDTPRTLQSLMLCGL